MLNNIFYSETLLNPFNHPDYFNVSDLFTVKDLFNARVHLGHREGSMHKNMTPFIFGSRLSHLVIDLDQTAELLRQALNFVAQVAYKDGIILFITRDAPTAHLVDRTAKEIGEFSHTRSWEEGIFTNSDMAFKIATRLPDLCIFLNTLENDLRQHRGIVSAAKMCIPTVAIVDTNSNPNLVTYPIPGNDDSECAIKLYCDLFKKAIFRGKAARSKSKQ